MKDRVCIMPRKLAKANSTNIKGLNLASHLYAPILSQYGK